jgi:hypothetical protein
VVFIGDRIEEEARSLSGGVGYFIKFVKKGKCLHGVTKKSGSG